jgi:pyridoxine 5-phosphate synthase
MTRLGVNIDHVATVRQARRVFEPDPAAAAVLVELAGAHGITIHLRGDRRHIQDRDVRLLRQTVSTKLNLEMAVTKEMLDIASEIRPDTATLVPETPQEITTHGGLDVLGNSRAVGRAIRTLGKAGVEVSLFIDPDEAQIRESAKVGAKLIELNTAAYSAAVPRALNEASSAFHTEFDKLASAAATAHSLGLRVLAGHGLTYRNVRPVSDLPEVEELNIGHNIICRAVLVGLERAVREMLAAMND